MCFSTNGQHSNGNKVCSYTCWPISSLLWGWSYSCSGSKEGTSFSLSFRYIDDMLSLNNLSFGDIIHRIYPKEIYIKDTKDTVNSTAYLDLYLEIGGTRKLLTKLYDKRVWVFIPYCQLPVYLWEHPLSTCVWSFHITIHTVCQHLTLT